MIYFFITFILDILFGLFISVSYQNISILFPCVLVGSFPTFHSLVKNKKLFFVIIVIVGLIYDTLFSDIFLVNTYYFLLYGLFIYVFYRNHEPKLLNLLIISILGVCLYDVFIFFILLLTGYSVFEFSYLCYKIKNTFLINFIYFCFSFILLKSRIFGYKKRKKK